MESPREDITGGNSQTQTWIVLEIRGVGWEKRENFLKKNAVKGLTQSLGGGYRIPPTQGFPLGMQRKTIWGAGPGKNFEGEPPPERNVAAQNGGFLTGKSPPLLRGAL